MTKEQLREQLLNVYKHYCAHRRSAELVATWWYVFRRVDAMMFWAALQAAHATASGNSPPTIHAVSSALRELEELKLRDIAPHTPEQALAFALSIARTCGPKLPAAYRVSAPFPLVMQTLKLVGFEFIWVTAHDINSGTSHLLRAPTAGNSRVAKEFTDTYSALRLRFFEIRDLSLVLAEAGPNYGGLQAGTTGHCDAARCGRRN